MLENLFDIFVYTYNLVNFYSYLKILLKTLHSVLTLENFIEMRNVNA